MGDAAQEDRKRLLDVAQDLREMFFLVVVIGEFNAGKSSFINALLGDELLPVGVTHVFGHFERGETVMIVNPEGRKIAHGLSNYDSEDLSRICGVKSDKIIDILSYTYGEAVHRDNLVMM